MTSATEIQTRLSHFAAMAKDAPPAAIFAQDGAPSKTLIAFCKTHGLTLDWAVTGEAPMYRAPRRNLNEVAESLTFLHALLQGLEHLVAEAETSATAKNAVSALAQEVVGKCNGILADIEAIEKAEGLA